MKIIEEMWRGNINIFDNALKETKESKQLWSLIEADRAKLETSLDEQQKEVLEALMDCVDELSELNERKVFSYAFRLGVQMMTECLKGELL